MLSFISERMTNEDKLAEARDNIQKSKPEVEKIRALIDMLQKFGVKDEISVDLSLARGLDYYTGLIWEVIIRQPKALPSMASGGRYDNLIGMYSKSRSPAVGSSIGMNRVFEVLGKEEVQRHTQTCSLRRLAQRTSITR